MARSRVSRFAVLGRPRPILVGAIAVLFAAGCGSSGPSGSVPSAGSTPATSSSTSSTLGVAGVDALPGVPQGVTPGLGDFLMACSDALIAAQTAVLAAESLGIGSCYIGDVLENGEAVAELLRLPRYAVPVAMLCFGQPKVQGRPTPHYEKHVVHRDVYRRLDEAELCEVSDELDGLHAPRGYREGIANTAQDVYARKFTAEFSVEMNRSAAWWLRRWTDGQ